MYTVKSNVCVILDGSWANFVSYSYFQFYSVEKGRNLVTLYNKLAITTNKVTCLMQPPANKKSKKSWPNWNKIGFTVFIYIINIEIFSMVITRCIMRILHHFVSQELDMS